LSIGLTVYIANEREIFNDEIIPNIMIDLNETLLTEYFIDCDGAEYIKTFSNHNKLYVLSCDEEMPILVNKNLYDQPLTYCYSNDFKNIPKELIKKERKENKILIHMIQKLKNKIVIFYWT
jgi:hypothetical protein